MLLARKVLFCLLLIIETAENAPDFSKHHIRGHSENHELFKEFMELFGDFSDADTETSDIIGDHLTDLTRIADACPRNEFFSNLHPEHMKAIGILKSIFAGTKNTRQFMRLAKVLRDREEVHPKVWYHALASHSYGNQNLQRIHKFTPLEVMPDVFINSDTLKNARSLQKDHKDINGSTADETCFIVDETVGAENGVENKLWYFREDIMLNSHHWYFHLLHPFENFETRPDRSGELFYYVHQSLLARYNTERLNLGLEKTLPLYPMNGGTIEEGYAPHLRDDISGKDWTARLPFSTFSDVKYPEHEILVDKMLYEPSQRIAEAINNGFLYETDGRQVSLWETDAIDILSEVVESTNRSINFITYSGLGIGSLGLHNNGHLVLGRVSDPKYELQLPAGVIMDTATAMRDPIFYRWHTFVDDIFYSYKQTLPPYQRTEGDHQLLWPGVHIQDLFVVSDRDDQEFQQPNELRSFWRTRKFSITRGLDFFRPQGSVPVEICAKHLDHDEFTYNFVIKREVNVEVSSATIRIFLAPRYDLSETQLSLTEQHRYFFVLDTFKTQLTFGLNTITRHSTQSSLTIPWSQSLTEANLGNSTTGVPNSRTPFCGCGFPHHLLLPKSRPSGLIFDLFVMVTNGEEDSVEETTDKYGPREVCQPAYLHCGIVNQKFPDAKPMGYPFDRSPYSGVFTDSGDTKSIETLEDYVAGVPNMAAIQVTIFQDVEPQNADSGDE